MVELKLIKVKPEDEKAVRYFVQADSMTDADAILAEELQKDYTVNPYTPKVYEDMIRLYDFELNTEEEELTYWECTWERLTIDDKTIKEIYLLLSEGLREVVGYISGVSDMELTSLKKLPVECILRGKVEEED